MKEQILEALKTKFGSTLGFTEKAYDGVANYLVATVTEASQIDTAISGVEPLLKAFQSDEDTRVGKIKKENEELKKKVGEEKKEDPKNPQPPKNETATEKQLREALEGINSLKTEIETIKSGGVLSNRKNVLDVDLKDAPESFKNNILSMFDRIAFKDDADFEEWRKDIVENKLVAHKKEVGEKDVSNISAPVYGKQDGGKSTFADTMKANADTQIAAKAEKK